jgi:protein SCO1
MIAQSTPRTRGTQSTRLFISVSLVSLVFSVGPAMAQMTGAPAPGYRRDAGLTASAVPKPLREVGFDQHLDRLMPLDVVLRDEQGRDVAIGSFFGRRPVVMAFVYYDCPMLCSMIMSAITSTLGVISLDVGRDFDVLFVSFDPRETPRLAADKKAEYLKQYGRSGAESGWHFLTGDQTNIARLTSAAGFRYAWDEDTRQFAHPAGLVVLTPEGRLARYLFGIEFGARDLRLALVEASAGRIGTPIDSALLYCYHYDPMTGRYGLAVMRALRISGAATVLLLASFIWIMIRRERR